MQSAYGAWIILQKVSAGVSFIRTSTPGSPGRPGCPATPGIPAFPLGPCTKEMNRMKLNKSQPKNYFLLLLSEHDELSSI